MIGTEEPPAAGTCTKRGRFWKVTDAAGQLVCLAVYKKGGHEVLRRLGMAPALPATAAETSTTKARTGQKGRGR